MKIACAVSLALCLSSAVALAAAAEENAVTRVGAAISSHVDSLAALLNKVPERARAGLGRALVEARKGRDEAYRTLGLEPDSSGLRPSSLPGARELFRLRTAVAASFRRSLAAIRRIDTRLPAEVSAGIEEARKNLMLYRKEALRSLGELLADSTGGRKEMNVPGAGDQPGGKNPRAQQPVGSRCHPNPPSASKPSSVVR
jgi:hypothetical protein